MSEALDRDRSASAPASAGETAGAAMAEVTADAPDHAGNGALPPHDVLDQRLAALPGQGARQLERLNQLAPDLSHRQAGVASQSLHHNRSHRSRLRLAVQLVDELARSLAPLAACKRGCAHCCHIRVEMTQLEAEQLGEAIGRRPNTRHRYQSPKPEDYGYDTPCPFLHDVQGQFECSIYEHRPFACRKHHSVDVDALFCRLDLPQRFMTGVAHVPAKAALLVYATAISPSMGLADIRDWFPGETELRRGPIGRIATAQQTADQAEREGRFG